jgi:secreted trypsin-like serine protease
MLLTGIAVLVLIVATAFAYFAVRSALRQARPERALAGGGGALAIPDVRATVKRVALAAGLPMFFAGVAAGYLLAQLGGTPQPPVGMLVYIGTDAKQGEFPYAAAMMRNQDAECGGTLFRLESMPVNSGQQWVLTAAHCYPATASGFAYGNVDLAHMPPPARIDRVCVHPELDAAVARLKEVTVQTVAAVLKPVSLQQNSKIEILGWGETYKKKTTLLQHATLDFKKALPCGLVASDACFAAASKTAASICSGDSGSPALLEWKPGDEPAVAGLAATISSCGGNKSRFVGTTSLIPWIEQMTRDPSTCKAL